MKKFSISLLIMLLVGLVLYAQNQERFAGTWKLNLAKSKYNPGPPPKSLTVKLEPNGEEMTVRSEGVDGEGNPVSWHFTAKPDGKDYPVTGWPAVDTVSVKRIDENRRESTYKKDGKVVFTNKVVLSKNGKMLTVTSTGMDAQGKKVKNVSVYDKQ